MSNEKIHCLCDEGCFLFSVYVSFPTTKGLRVTNDDDDR